MVITAQRVSPKQRCEQSDADQIIFWMGVTLGRKFTALTLTPPSVETIREWVSRKQAPQIIHELQQGIIPSRLYQTLPQELQEALVQADMEAVSAEATAALTAATAVRPPALNPPTTRPDQEHRQCPICYQEGKTTWLRPYEKCPVCDTEYVPEPKLPVKHHST